MRRIFFILCLFCFLGPVRGNASDCNEQIGALVEHGAVLLLADNATVCDVNGAQELVPASILKINTSLAALNILGPEYRFATEFFLADDILYIKGSGDPYLVSEEVGLIAKALRHNGLGVVKDIVLDDSACELGEMADGIGASLNPYDAGNGCLAVNFNTVNIEVTAKGAVVSAEEQTPTLPLMRRLGSGLARGTHRINITRENDFSLDYAGQLFAAKLAENGITVQGGIRSGKAPQTDPPFYVHRSTRALPQVVEGLLLFSNNYIANQLFLACGQKRFGRPATWEKGRRAIADFYHKAMGIGDDEIRISEGSGLSRKNRVTARAMVKVLQAFKPYARLLPRHDDAWVKSGTLTGVYSYAGYLPRGNGLASFVIILNQEKNRRDRILSVLQQIAD